MSLKALGVLAIDVTLKKEDYGVPGLSDYRKNALMATAGLSEKFSVDRHKIVTGGRKMEISRRVPMCSKSTRVTSKAR
jgi:hypothetical protein